MAADESLVLLKSAIADLGIACLPETIAAESIRKGEFVQVLPSWIAGFVTTTILTLHRRGQLPALRAVIDFLSEDARRTAAAGG